MAELPLIGMRPAQVALGSLRVCAALVVVALLWNQLGADKLIDRAITGATRLVLTSTKTFTPRTVRIPGDPEPKTAQLKVNQGLGLPFGLSVFVPLLIFVFLPIRSWRALAANAALGTLFVAVCDVALTCGFKYRAFLIQCAIYERTLPHTALDELERKKAVLALGLCFYVFPLLAALAAHAVTARLARRRYL